MAGSRSALIVSTYQYDDPRLRLVRAPERDVDALAEVLADPAIGGFDVQTLVNRSSGDISVRVASFFAQRGPDDVLLLHFTCYAVMDDSGELFLATTDTRMDLLEATACLGVRQPKHQPFPLELCGVVARLLLRRRMGGRDESGGSGHGPRPPV